MRYPRVLPILRLKFGVVVAVAEVAPTPPTMVVVAVVAVPIAAKYLVGLYQHLLIISLERVVRAHPVRQPPLPAPGRTPGSIVILL